MTVVLLFIVMFTDGAPQLRGTVPMPALDICGQAIADAKPPAMIGGHVVARWSAACVVAPKVSGS